MNLNEKVYALVRERGVDAANDFLDSYGRGRDREESSTIAHWRSVFLSKNGKFAEALDCLDKAASDFDCKSALALKRARCMNALDRVGDAIAILKATPIADEVERYPGLAWEAAYFGCYLYKKQGLSAPQEWLDLIPDDFTTRIDDRPVNKSFIQNAAG